MSLGLFIPESPVLQAAFPTLIIKDLLGEGGQKFVFLAKDEMDRLVALKLIKSDQDKERIAREVEAVTQFSPPRFPVVYEWGEIVIEDQNMIFILEEYIEGISLKKQIECGALDERQAVHIGYELLLALEEVSQRKLVHRDIKPDNVMLGQNGRVVLLDFGIARHLQLTSITQDLDFLGPMTAGYAAPEQINNEKRAISSRTDLFAWGIVMYEMISGINPFTHEVKSTSEKLIRTLKYNPPKLLNGNLHLSDMIEWCLRKPAHKRPVSPSILRKKFKEVFTWL